MLKKIKQNSLTILIMVLVLLLSTLPVQAKAGVQADSENEQQIEGWITSPEYVADIPLQNSPDTVTMEIVLSSNDDAAREILTKVNEYRAEHGLQALRWSDALAEKAKQRMSEYIVNAKRDETSDRQPYIYDDDFYDFYTRQYYGFGYAAPPYQDGRYKLAPGIDLADVKSVACVSAGINQFRTLMILSKDEAPEGQMPATGINDYYYDVKIKKADVEVTFNRGGEKTNIYSWDQMDKSQGVCGVNLQGETVYDFGPRSVSYTSDNPAVGNLNPDGTPLYNSNGETNITAIVTDISGQIIGTVSRPFVFKLPPKPIYVDLIGDGYDFRQAARKVLDLVNAERAKVDVEPVVWNEDMADFAALRAAEIGLRFSHNRPDGSSAMINQVSGENIAAGSTTPERVMNQWMNSAHHKSNILNPRWKSMSIGAYGNSEDYPLMWTQLFSDELPTTAEPATFPVARKFYPVVPVNLVEVDINISDEDGYGLPDSLNVVSPTKQGFGLWARTNIAYDQFSYLDLFSDQFKLTSDNTTVAKVNKNFVHIVNPGQATITFTLVDYPEAWSYDYKVIFKELNGWVKRGADVYYYRDGQALTGLQKIGRTVYLFNSQGIRQYGWHVIDGVPMYFNLQNGGRWTGLRTIGNTTYLLDAKRGKLTGWHVINNIPMYFDPVSGGRLTGLQKIGKTTYLLHGTKGKLMGWHVLNGRKHYFSPDYGGGMVTGLRKIGKAYYYFDVGVGYAYTNSWIFLAGKYHYFNSNGIRTKIQSTHPGTWVWYA